jgi:hypothetical protein
VGLFLAVLTGFFMHYYMQDAFAIMENPTIVPVINWWAYGGMMIAAISFSLFVNAVTGTILYKQAKGTLTPDTEWEDLKDSFFPIAGKIFIQGCILGLICAVPSAIMGFLLGVLTVQGNALMAGFAAGLFLVAFFALMIVLIPALSLIQYPIYLEEASAWEGIKKGFQWGFKYWGSTFLSFFLGIVIMMVAFYILSMPYIIYIVLKMGGGGWIGYLLSALMFAASLILQPLYIVFMGFQYTSIASHLSNDN